MTFSVLPGVLLRCAILNISVFSGLLKRFALEACASHSPPLKCHLFDMPVCVFSIRNWDSSLALTFHIGGTFIWWNNTFDETVLLPLDYDLLKGSNSIYSLSQGENLCREEIYTDMDKFTEQLSRRTRMYYSVSCKNHLSHYDARKSYTINNSFVIITTDIYMYSSIIEDRGWDTVELHLCLLCIR